MLGWEITGGDGSVTLYGATATNFRVAFCVFDGRTIASRAYSSGGLVSNYPTTGTNVTSTASPGATNLGTINLPPEASFRGRSQGAALPPATPWCKFASAAKRAHTGS